jgi:hypothetical protein
METKSEVLKFFGLELLNLHRVKGNEIAKGNESREITFFGNKLQRFLLETLNKLMTESISTDLIN